MKIFLFYIATAIMKIILMVKMTATIIAQNLHHYLQLKFRQKNPGIKDSKDNAS